MSCETSLAGGKFREVEQVPLVVWTRRYSSFVPCCGMQRLVTVEFEFRFGVVCKEKKNAVVCSR